MGAAEFTILLVEDDTDQIHFVERAFAKCGTLKSPTLKVCKDGDEAIAYLAGDGLYKDRSTYPLPSLVLLDLKLPK